MSQEALSPSTDPQDGVALCCMDQHEEDEINEAICDKIVDKFISYDIRIEELYDFSDQVSKSIHCSNIEIREACLRISELEKQVKKLEESSKNIKHSDQEENQESNKQTIIQVDKTDEMEMSDNESLRTSKKLRKTNLFIKTKDVIKLLVGQLNSNNNECPDKIFIYEL